MRKLEKRPVILAILLLVFLGFGFGQVTQTVLEAVTDSGFAPAVLPYPWETFNPMYEGAGVCSNSGYSVRFLRPGTLDSVVADSASSSRSFISNGGNPFPLSPRGAVTCTPTGVQYLAFTSGKTSLWQFGIGEGGGTREVFSSGKTLTNPSGIPIGFVDEIFGAVYGYPYVKLGIYYHPMDDPNTLYQGVVNLLPGSGVAPRVIYRAKASEKQFLLLGTGNRYLWIWDLSKKQVVRIGNYFANGEDVTEQPETVFTGVLNARVLSIYGEAIVGVTNANGFQLTRFQWQAIPAAHPETKVVVNGQLNGQPIGTVVDFSAYNNGPLYLITQPLTGPRSLMKLVGNQLTKLTSENETAIGDYTRIVVAKDFPYLATKVAGGGGKVYRLTQTTNLPRIDAITNAASGEVLSGVATGTWITLWGSSFTNRADTAVSVPFPEILGGVRVIFRRPSDGALYSAPLWFVGPEQINALVPDGIAGESFTDIYVKLDGKTTESNRIRLNVVSASPGLSQYGGRVLVQESSTGRVLDPQEPVMADQWYTSYCTGCGPTTPSAPFNQPVSSDVLRRVNGGCKLEVDSQPVEVAFCGLTPGSIGLWQINFRLPLSLPGGSVRRATLAVGGQSADLSRP